MKAVVHSAEGQCRAASPPAQPAPPPAAPPAQPAWPAGGGATKGRLQAEPLEQLRHLPAPDQGPARPPATAPPRRIFPIFPVNPAANTSQLSTPPHAAAPPAAPPQIASISRRSRRPRPGAARSPLRRPGARPAPPPAPPASGVCVYIVVVCVCLCVCGGSMCVGATSAELGKRVIKSKEHPATKASGTREGALQRGRGSALRVMAGGLGHKERRFVGR